LDRAKKTAELMSFFSFIHYPNAVGSGVFYFRLLKTFRFLSGHVEIPTLKPILKPVKRKGAVVMLFPLNVALVPFVPIG
jgi:hypothetical protein